MAEIKMSDAVANRIRTGDYLVALVESNSAADASALRDLFHELPALELNLSQVHPFIKALGALLRGATRELEAKELAYLAELADDEGPRAVRDEQVASLTEMLQRTKELIRGCLGADGLATYGLDTPLPQMPDELIDRTAGIAKLLRDNPDKATDPLGLELDPPKVAEKLTLAMGPLGQSLETLAREENERIEALRERDQSIEAWTGIYRGVATTLSGLIHLAGFTTLAEQIRPTEARASGKE